MVVAQMQQLQTRERSETRQPSDLVVRGVDALSRWIDWDRVGKGGKSLIR
jgi:hypothetical protein